MVITVISVATPIVKPSIVSDARSLCARSALKHSSRLSPTDIMREGVLQLVYLLSATPHTRPPRRPHLTLRMESAAYFRPAFDTHLQPGNTGRDDRPTPRSPHRQTPQSGPR